MNNPVLYFIMSNLPDERSQKISGVNLFSYSIFIPSYKLIYELFN
jgi:hypothetical protein